MRIGIHVTNKRNCGGQLQFLAMFLNALFNSALTHEIYLFYFDDQSNLSKKYKKEKWHWVDLKKELGLINSNYLLPNAIVRILKLFKKTAKSKAVPRRLLELKAKLLFKYKLDFIFFPVWTDSCWEWGIPFGLAVHDLQHRLQPEFPEVSGEGRWGGREDFFLNAVSKAKIVLVDSVEGKNNVLQFYGCEQEKIKILPYTIPPTSMIHISGREKEAIIKKLNIPKKFLFYPANFWPHKNHYRIAEAIGLIKRKYDIEVSIVFVGQEYSQWDILSMCKILAKRYSMEEQIYYLGYVAGEELAALYMTAVALVMPTYFGPTNIPYIEAFYYNCPVIASDIPGIREQVGEAALLVNPKDTEAISNAMYRIWTNQNLRENLVKKGQERLKEFLPECFSEKLSVIIDNLSR